MIRSGQDHFLWCIYVFLLIYNIILVYICCVCMYTMEENPRQVYNIIRTNVWCALYILPRQRSNPHTGLVGPDDTRVRTIQSYTILPATATLPSAHAEEEKNFDRAALPRCYPRDPLGNILRDVYIYWIYYTYIHPSTPLWRDVFVFPADRVRTIIIAKRLIECCFCSACTSLPIWGPSNRLQTHGIIVTISRQPFTLNFSFVLRYSICGKNGVYIYTGTSTIWTPEAKQ